MPPSFQDWNILAMLLSSTISPFGQLLLSHSRCLLLEHSKDLQQLPSKRSQETMQSRQEPLHRHPALWVNNSVKPSAHSIYITFSHLADALIQSDLRQVQGHFPPRQVGWTSFSTAGNRTGIVDPNRSERGPPGSVTSWCVSLPCFVRWSQPRPADFWERRDRMGLHQRQLHWREEDQSDLTEKAVCLFHVFKWA